MSKKENKQYVEKKVDYSLCSVAQFLSIIRCAYFENIFSQEANKKFYDLINQIYSDIGHLECDVFEGEYVVEYGYNNISKE